MTIQNSETTSYGGGIYANSGTLMLTDCTLSGNPANRGSGIYINYSRMTMTNCTLSGNSANRGGGIYNNYGTLTLTNCSISENSVTGTESAGGGIYNYAGTMTLTNCTITGNTASYGGGFDNFGTMTLTNCTVTGNSASIEGGGVYIYGSSNTLLLYNSIVACNTASSSGDDIHKRSGSIKAYNTLSSYTAWNSNDSCYVYDSTKPLFTNAANGDYTLATNSQAIDKGNNSYAVDAEGNPLLYDLAGNGRINNNIVDLGAYEFYKAFWVTTVNDVVDANDGVLSLREAISLAQDYDFIKFDASLAGKTITLNGNALSINKTLTIDASSLGSDGVTISGAKTTNIFNVTGGTEDNPVSLINLTLTNGKSR